MKLFEQTIVGLVMPTASGVAVVHIFISSVLDVIPFFRTKAEEAVAAVAMEFERKL